MGAAQSGLRVALLDVQKKLESPLDDPDMAAPLSRSVHGRWLIQDIRALIATFLKQKEPALIRDLFGHQLIARQRWHAVLLGRQVARLANDERGTEEARLLHKAEAGGLTPDLRPRTRRKPRR